MNFNHEIYFNGVALPSFVIIKGITTQILSDIDNEILSTRKGNKLKRTTFGSKTITIDFSIEKQGQLTPFEQQQELLKWVRGNNWKESKLVLSDDGYSYYMAICNNSIELNNSDIEGVGKIEFLVADGIRYTSRIMTTDIDAIKNYDFELGNIEIEPIITFTITAPCSELKLKIDNLAYNNFIRMKHNFLTNDKVVIDMRTKKITINGELKQEILTLDSKFHTLDPLLSANIYTLEIGNANVGLELQGKYL